MKINKILIFSVLALLITCCTSKQKIEDISNKKDAFKLLGKKYFYRFNFRYSNEMINVESNLFINVKSYKNIIMKIIIYLFIMLFTYSCISDNTSSKEVLRLSVPEKAYNDSLDKYFEIDNIIFIETKDNALISDIKKIITYKDKLILLNSIDNKIIVINSITGRIINIIHKTGNGPGESNKIIDIAFDDSSEKILVYNDYYKLLMYNINGDFLNEERVEDCYENIIYDNGNILFYNKLNGYSCYPYKLMVYNLKDKIFKYVGNDKELRFPIRSKGKLIVKSKNIWFSAPTDFNMYKITDNKIQNPYCINIPNNNLSESFIEKSKTDPQSFFDYIYSKKIIYSINSIRETSRYIICQSNHSDIFLIDKNNNEIKFKSSPVINSPKSMEAYYYPHEGNDNKIMFVIPAHKYIMKDYLMKHCKSDILKQKVSNTSLKTDDNPIILLYKEKE